MPSCDATVAHDGKTCIIAGQPWTVNAMRTLLTNATLVDCVQPRAVERASVLIAVGGNPLEDINNVRRLQLVLKEGAIVSDRRDLWAGPLPPAF